MLKETKRLKEIQELKRLGNKRRLRKKKNFQRVENSNLENKKRMDQVQGAKPKQVWVKKT